MLSIRTASKRLIKLNMSSNAQLRLNKLNSQLNTKRKVSSFSIPNVKNVKQGTKYASDFKQYALNEQGNIISYFHDIPLNFDAATGEANMVTEIPRWSNGKFEINLELEGNPITQDIKKGKVRFVKNLFPHHGYIHNYGAFPQTWEDPTSVVESIGLAGDNDPLDVCEIGSDISSTGEVKRVKILGSLALIDDGELDWKIIVINTSDPLASELHDLEDVRAKCPKLLENTRQWFRDYKLPDGKPQNKFAFDGQYKGKNETLEVIQECHDAWKRLISGKVIKDNCPNTSNVTIEGTSGFLKAFNQLAILDNEYKGEANIPQEVNRNYFF